MKTDYNSQADLCKFVWDLINNIKKNKITNKYIRKKFTSLYFINYDF